MSVEADYAHADLTRAEVDGRSGPLILEFGANWCGICRAARPAIVAALEAAAVPHWRIEDGPGRRLGRSFAVKLWPTLIFLRDGREIERIVRPAGPEALVAALGRLQG
ncbi:MAG: thioredoxin family protein [Betaproteobacteria bacterium]|nr:thioredoxin family protein [Betaproteobacteria bacterium]MBK8916616.1 thioredoxin family protein [Betaproteobacteria bacterium]